MATYINKKTGAHLVTDDVVTGGDWIKGDVIPAEDMTIPEIKSRLDELGVEYNAKANKAELLALYKEHQGA